MDFKTSASVVTGAMNQLADKTTAIAAQDSWKVTDVGKAIIDSNGDVVRNTAETFLQAAISQIAKIEIDRRAYKGDLDVLMIQDTEYGNATERIYFDLATIIDDPKWNLFANYQGGKTNYAAEETGFYPTTAYGKLFDEFKGILTPISRPTDQLKEAVRGEDEMREFLTGIETVVLNTLENGLQSYRHMLIQAGIAVAMAKNSTAVNINQAYYDLTGTDITNAGADKYAGLKNKDFLIFLAQTIAEVRDNLKVFTNVYNDGSGMTFSPEDYQKLVILNKVEKAMRFNVAAQVFNADKTTFGPYTTTTAWQGISDGTTAMKIGELSKVMVSADATNKLGIGTAAWTGEGVVGVLFDKYAMSICPYKRKTTGNYIAVGDYFNEFHRLGLNLILDDHYPIVVFYLGAVTP